MVARFCSRLSYANVVATLALFVALGGTGYAASQLTGRDIKNRSISRVDIKKNALTGTEINESKLKQVPNALNSITANSALAADVAKNSQSADTAAVAGIANDARALAGQGAATFERASRTDFGLGPTPTGASQEKALIAWPELGAEVRTVAGVCGGSNMQMAVKNTRAAGGGAITMFEGNSAIPVTPGNVQNVCSNAQDQSGDDLAHLDMQVGDSGANGRAWFVQCFKVFSTAQETRCVGVRSQP
jgi:hypothetical protein